VRTLEGAALGARSTSSAVTTLSGNLRRYLGANVRTTAGSSMLSFAAVFALFAPLIAPFDPNRLAVGARLTGPSMSHLLGTDQFGRDEFSRIVYGARISVGVAMTVGAVALAIGLPLGMIIAYRGGWLDAIASRVLDALFSFPAILLALALTTILGPGLNTVVVALIVIYTPIVARFVRGAMLVEKGNDYITAAKIAGAPSLRIMRREILPNIVSPVVVLATSIMAFTILAEAALSYLGFGSQPPSSSWGRMLTESTPYFTTAPYLALFPGFAITFLVLALNLLGDGLRDQLDPIAQRVAGKGVTR
jgi:peptide/nickel transport system permease protein